MRAWAPKPISRAGSTVRRKAVFVYEHAEGLKNERDPLKRADDLGAAVVFDVSMLPGNMH